MAERRERRALPDYPKWVNPCGHKDPPNPNSMSFDVASSIDQVLEVLQQIALQAKNALQYAEAQKDDYVRRTFKVEFNTHHQEWKSINYDWLMTKDVIVKDLDEDIPVEHLVEIQKNLDDTLLKVYKFLQRIAVGLEQVTYDQLHYDGQFLELFKSSEHYLRVVLCEVQSAMIERGIEWKEDVSRDIMDAGTRDIPDNTRRNLRDWFIYRDYMNALQYIIQVFDSYSEFFAESSG